MIIPPLGPSADASTPWQFGFQDPASPVMQGIIDLHNDIMGIMVFIFLFVCYILGAAVVYFEQTKNPSPSVFTHGTVIEIAWTVTPSLVLIGIALPSFALLYSTDELHDPSITLKVLGHQWYWTYEYSDYADNLSSASGNPADESSLVYDSYMVPEDDLELGQLRLLEVDNRVVLPVATHIRVIISSADVIHSWAVPSLGVKCDALPGRLNQTSMFIDREGVFYGQCSEICGANHGFMPIVVEAVKTQEYLDWLLEKYNDM
jgi:cytochrome c oxidase subunit 2